MLTYDGQKILIKSYFECKSGDHIIFEINNLIGRINLLNNGLYESEIFENPHYNYKNEFWDDFSCNSQLGFIDSNEAFEWIKNESEKYLKYM